MSKKVSDILPKTEILAQLAEEASELAQATLKLRRALDNTNPTPKSVAECEANLTEEIADVTNAIDALFDSWFGASIKSESEFWDAELEIEDAKYKRWLSRLEAKENKNGLQLWRTKSDVTDEAVSAVLSHFIIEMERSDKTKLEKAWGVIGNKKLKVTFELSTNKEQSDE